MPAHDYRWFPGYTVAAVSMIALIASAPGQTFIISQINLPLREALEISELQLNTAYTIATVAAAFPLVLVGALTDRLGPRRMLAIVALAFGLACMLMSRADGLITVLIGFFLLRFLGQGALVLVGQHAVAMWFHRRLGSVHGIKQVIAFAVWIGAPQLAVRLIEDLGWRQTYFFFGLAIWITVVPLALWLVRNKPEDLNLKMDGDPPTAALPHRHEPEAARPKRRHIIAHPDAPEPAFTRRQAAGTRAYWILVAAVFLPPLIGTAMLFDIQPLVAARGMTAADAANAVSAWTATMCLMAIPVGYLTDRVRPSVLITAGMAAIALSPALLLIAWSPILVAISFIIFGVGQALTMACTAATIARYFGRLHHGAIRSAIVRIGIIGTGLGPIFTALSVARTGSYAPALLAFTAMSIPVAVVTTTLRQPPPPATDT